MGNRKKNHNRFLSGIVVFLASAIALYLAFTGGYYIAKQDINPKIIPGRITNLDVSKPKDVDFSLFWDVWNKTHRDYFGKTDDQQMVYGAIQGSLASMGDPYTIFLDPELNKKFREDISGEFEGIGAELSTRNNVLTIVAPLDGSPAAKAGLMPGDIIESINGQKTDGLTTDQAVDLIRGPEGSEVTISIIRAGVAKEYKIKREIIKVKSVKYSFQNYSGKQVAILEISQFNEDTVALVDEFTSECLKKKCDRIIIDVRNNPGGYLDGAIDVASIFIKEGVVLKEVDKKGEVTEYRTSRPSQLDGKKVVVLMNNGSASSAEILAGALADNDVGILMGVKSFGKGSVQVVEDLKNGAALKMTIAHWLTPKGTEIDKTGLEPKIKVEMTEDDIAKERDPQLDAALLQITS